MTTAATPQPRLTDADPVELSTKCRPSEAFQVAAEARAFPPSRGIDLSGEQETRTRKALMYFADAPRAGG